MKAHSQQLPHEPNGNRYIRHDVGNTVYIVQEKNKEQATFLSVAIFQKDAKSNVIEACLRELNKD